MMSIPLQARVAELEAHVAELTQANRTLHSQLDRTTLLYEVSGSLNAALDFETIVTKAVGFAKYFEATSGEIHLLTDMGDVYFKSSYPERNVLDDLGRQTLVRRVLQDGLDAWVLRTGQLALVLDTLKDERWLPVEYSDQTISVRSAICAPIYIGYGRLKGAISFVHPAPNHFSQQDLTLLGTFTAHIATALENAYTVSDIKNSLREAHLMLDTGRHLSGTSSLKQVHRAITQSTATIGADQCVLFMCRGLSSNNLPTHAEITLLGSPGSEQIDPPASSRRLSLAEHKALAGIARDKEALIIENVDADERLTDQEKALFQRLDIRSLVINPLVTQTNIIGMLTIAYRSEHIFTEWELAVQRTLCDQATTALEHVRQIERTEQALAETQALYRAGRVLAGDNEIRSIIQDALVEFVYSLGLDQGRIILLTADQQRGEVAAYLENGELRSDANQTLEIDRQAPYQRVLFSGQPYVNAGNDPELASLTNLGQKQEFGAILMAPLIIQGKTAGWITAEAIDERRAFNQREIDLARAMSDQIAIAIQNRRLLEQSERRTEQLRAVAKVGEAVTGLTDLNEVLTITVNLIRNRFGFYHVSIFLIDAAREWAVVKASTGEIGKIMVERPHRLGVGSNSIVGFVTQHNRPRIALDVGKDAVHFNNPLLPRTRSEMALPLASRGVTIGALDVQSEQANAFTSDDVEALQIMADQVTTAIETARLFEKTERRLDEQALLYRIGSRLGSTLELYQTADILVTETAQMLSLAKCSLVLMEDHEHILVVRDYVRPGSKFPNEEGNRQNVRDVASLPQMLATQQEVIIEAADESATHQEIEALKNYDGSVMGLLPIALREEIIGFLAVYDDLPGRQLSQDDVALLDAIALLAANGIENARLFAAARESQGFMKAIIDQIPDPIYIKDRQQKWTVVNTAFTTDILNATEEEVLGRTDFDFLDDVQARWFWEQGQKMLETGEIQETETTISTQPGTERTLYMRNIPLTLSQSQEQPEYIIGIIQDISGRKQREQERERMIEETRRTLKRTQTLYRISAALTIALDRQKTFEHVLGEYLNLLGREHGAVFLYNKSADSNIAQARYVGGRAVEPKVVIPSDEDRVFQRLSKEPKPLLIKNPHSHALTRAYPLRVEAGDIIATLFIPLVIRGQLLGTMVVSAKKGEPLFDQSDIETGQAIAEQLTMWLENRQLLEEAQHRSDSLQTAAEVSQAASSILDIDELIETSVNLIRDRFDFYYVGLFLLDEAGEWAVLKAGTGEAGRIQLQNNHRLKIDNESMIGWSIAHHKARIALDVGEEAVHFKNPVLLDTRSEIALPLISRDDVLGALTVQSTRRLAFSIEDITLLQTMADQLANAIKNANLFAQTQEALAEAEALYRVTQALATTRDQHTIYQLAIESVSKTGIDSATIYSYVEQRVNGISERFVEPVATWRASGKPPATPGTRIKANDFALEQLVPHRDFFSVEDPDNDPRLTPAVRQQLTALDISALLIFPLSTRQGKLGFLLVAYHHPNKKFSKNKIRYFNTVAQQIVVALENLRLLDDSQKRARREEIIREISGKIRNATDVNDIMKTTVAELGKLVGTSRGRITLGVDLPGARETDPVPEEWPKE